MWYQKVVCRLVVLLFFVGCLQAQEKYATKGTVTEALFILQNKHRELLEYIQSLKKKLTDCFAQKKLLQANGCKAKNMEGNEVEINQCTFYQKVFPAYIKELEDLASSSLERIQDLSKDEPVQADSLKAGVDYAFLIKEKIELESAALELFLGLDKQEWELEFKIKKPQKKLGTNMQALAVRKQKRNIAFSKRKLKTKREALARINAALYKDKSDQLEKTLLNQLTGSTI